MLASWAGAVQENAMPPDEEARRIVEEIKKRITPQLEEMGVRGFLICGYIEPSPGVKTRMLAVVDQGDPAIADGLRPVAFAAAVWGDLFHPDEARDPQG